jgi:ClpP class serine protease
MSLLKAALSARWALTEDALTNLLSIAARTHEVPEALMVRDGQPLDRTDCVEVRDGVAILPVSGPLFRYGNLFTQVCGATSYQLLARDFTAAVENPNVRAIILDIDSPGGEVNGFLELADVIFGARGKKPIVAYVGGMGASAAYGLAAACDKIVAFPSAMVGSIGCVTALVDRTKQDEENGIERRTIVSSNAPKKRLEGFTEEAIASVQAKLDALESVFVSRLSKYRGVSEDVILSKYGRGDSLVAGAPGGDVPSGLEAGLVDELGSFESVLASLAPPSTTPGVMPAAPRPGAQKEAASAQPQETLIMEALLAALGLSATASAEDVGTAVASLTSFRSDVLAVAGATNTSEALGKLQAFKVSHAQVPELLGKVDQLEKDAADRKIVSSVSKAIREGRATPAQRETLLAMGRSNPDQLKAFLAASPVMPAARPVAPPTDSTAVHALTEEDKAVAKQLKLDPAKFAAAKAASNLS